MAITGAIAVALNGFEAKVTTKEETKALILDNVSEIVKGFAEGMPVELLDRYSERYGIGFEVHDGKIAHVVFN